MVVRFHRFVVRCRTLLLLAVESQHDGDDSIHQQETGQHWQWQSLRPESPSVLLLCDDGMRYG